MAAAGLADVGAADLQPLVLGRRVEHPLEQLAVAGLELRPFAQLDPGAGDPIGERVPNRLQLAEPQHPRLAGAGSYRGIDLDPRKRLGEKRPELRFQAPDLPPQLHSRQPLVATDANRVMSVK
ncbi:MAG TPA: hypothetical protein VJ989_10245 [Solirubrobacterales bacterium]|nr:hypothetical protein [Solirubrobacterales bacterium]